MSKHCMFAVVGVICLFLMGTISQAIPVKATMSSIVGDVQIMPPGGSWQPATEGGMIENGTEIKTGAKSSCVLRWSSQNTMKLTPFTQFTVKSIDIDPRTKTVKSDLDMFAGKVKLRAEKLQNPNSRFEVTTPSAVAGVRGTTGDVEQGADEASIITRDGMIECRGIDGAVYLIGPGEQCIVDKDG
ncbi:MAG: FecR family protein, partial [bacterium]